MGRFAAFAAKRGHLDCSCHPLRMGGDAGCFRTSKGGLEVRGMHARGSDGRHLAAKPCCPNGARVLKSCGAAELRSFFTTRPRRFPTM